MAKTTKKSNKHDDTPARIFRTLPGKPLGKDMRLTLADKHTKLDLLQRKLKSELEENKSENSAEVRRQKKRIDEIDQEIGDISNQLNEGLYKEKIEVLEEPDDARATIVYVRADTKQPIGETRPVTEKEAAEARDRLQGKLFDGKGNEVAPETIEQNGQELVNVRAGRKGKRARKAARAEAEE